MNEKILSTRENSTKSHKNFFLILTTCIAFKRGEMSKHNLLPYLKCLNFLPLPNHTFTPFFSSIIAKCISMICIVCNRFLFYIIDSANTCIGNPPARKKLSLPHWEKDKKDCCCCCCCCGCCPSSSLGCLSMYQNSGWKSNTFGEFFEGRRPLRITEFNWNLTNDLKKYTL